MKDLDKTKEKLKLEELNEAQRKELFNKFVNAGGEVISEREERRRLVIDREKQREHQQKLDEHFRSMKTGQGGVSSARPSYAKKSAKKRAELYDSPYNRFRIRMRLRFLGVTGFNTLFFKGKFLDKFTGQYRSALMTVQMAYLSIFKRDPRTGERVISRLDKASLLYYDVIERAGEIYEPIIMDQITENYRNYPNVSQPVTELREPLSIIFRSLFILKPYENTLINSFEKAIDFFEQVTDSKISKSVKKRDIRNALFIVFDKIYPRLHTLYCYYNGILFSETDSKIDELLQIIPVEKPGQRTRTKRSAVQDSGISPASLSEEEAEAGMEEGEKTESLLDTDVKEGLKLMYRLDFNTLRKMYDKKGRFELIAENDKTFLAYLFFLEFEKEYSVILTTSKIKYNTDFSYETKYDYRESLQELFNRMRKCHESFNTYYDAFGSLCLVKNDRPVTNEQYIPYSKRLDEALKKKNEVGNICRHIIRTYMGNVSDVLKELIADMNENQRYINNPQDPLDLQYEIEGEMKLKDKKIYDAIQIVQRYAAALSFRLSPGGDLTGNSDFSEDNKTGAAGSSDGEERGKSFLDELDDII